MSLVKTRIVNKNCRKIFLGEVTQRKAILEAKQLIRKDCNTTTVYRTEAYLPELGESLVLLGSNRKITKF